MDATVVLSRPNTLWLGDLCFVTKFILYLFIAYIMALSKGQFIWCRLEGQLIKNAFHMMLMVAVVAQLYVFRYLNKIIIIIIIIIIESLE